MHTNPFQILSENEPQMISNQEIEKEGGVFFINTTTSAAGNHHATAVNPTTTEQCSSCGSTKRRSLFSSSFLQEQHIPKKPTLSPPPPPSSAAVNGHLLEGFTKIQLPTTNLRRTISEPINSISNPQLSPAAATFSNTHSPENLNKIQSPAKNPFLPPCNLQRSISDPTPALIFPHSPQNNTKITPTATATETTTSLPPLRQILRRKLSDPMNSGEMGMDSIRGESPSSKELKKMKDIFRVMSQWFSQAIQQVEEDEEEQEGSEFNHNHENPKEDHDSENETDEEAVSVDWIGECIKVEFKCPCGKGYQILLSGNACYYKLM